MQGLASGIAGVALVTAGSSALLADQLPDIVMLYLLCVVVVALRFGAIPSLVTGVLGVAACDFFFSAPYHSLAVADPHLAVTFVIMLAVGSIISGVAEEARRSEIKARDRERDAQTERLRNALLSSVSHDLRTPLAVVKGAATALLEGGDDLPAARRGEYLQTISDEASRLSRLVRNLLDMTTLEADALRVRREWQPIEEVVGVALGRLEESLRDRQVKIWIAPEAALAPFDGILIEQVLINLVENAIRYTPAGTPIEISARRVAAGAEIEVADSGPGVAHGKEALIFEKFQRASDVHGGMGIGLTICRGIVTAHGGRIEYQTRQEGGASFRLLLPFEGEAPPLGELPEAVGDP
jgi:two-component system sensor histidine kinase KdpD